jgi:tetratricopeptide (TPR) repeat protein
MYWRGLWLADGPRWPLDADYSPELAAALRLGFAHVAPPLAAGPEEHLTACAVVSPWLRARMSARQRVRVHFLLARTHEVDGTISRAVDCVNEALGAAAHSHLLRDLAELLSYRATLERAREKFRAAAEDLEASLALLAMHPTRADLSDPALRLQLLSQLAMYDYFLADYRAARRTIKQARLLFSQAPRLAQAAAAVLWVEAHLARTRGLPERAWFPTLTAVEIYEHEGSLATQDRIRSFVADLALDLVAATPGGAASREAQAFLGITHSSLRQAERLARSAEDQPGLGLIQLVRARAGRLSWRNEDRRPAIERVIVLAERLGDDGLRAQALTTQGDELTFLGEAEQAHNRYRAALDALQGAEMPVLAVAPRRALLRVSEFDTGLAE